MFMRRFSKVSRRLNVAMRGIAFLLTLPLLGLQGFAQTLPIQEYTLPSGQKVYIQENHARPIVTIDTWVDTGSVNEVGDNNGVSHFLEHLLFKGTPTNPAGEFEKRIEAKGGEFNAATSQDFTHYYITVASPFFAEALKLHADMLLNAHIPADELERERKVVQEEINRAQDNPHQKLFMAMDRLLFGEHGYALDTLGPKELIGSIPRDSILGYYRYWYKPEHLKTVIVGDIQPKQALDLVKSTFQNQPNGLAQAYSPPPGKIPTYKNQPQSQVIVDPKVAQAYTILAFPGPSIENREDTYAMDVAMQALGQGRSSRLFRDLRERQQLVQSISGGNMTQKQAGIIYVMYQATPENREKAFKAVLEKLQDAKLKGITEEELDKVKTQFIKDFIFHNESTQGVAQGIGYNVVIGTLADYTDYIGNIQKVTREDALKALQKYLRFDQAVAVSVVPAKSAKEPAKAVEQRMIAALSQTANQSQQALAIAQEQQAQGTPLPDNQQQTTETSTIRSLTLPNGMTVVLKPWPEAQTTAMKIFIKGGQLVEPIPGVSGMVARLLTQGTTSRSNEEIHEILDRRGMNLSISAQSDYLEVTASAVKEDFGELFLLVQDVLNNATFPQKELQKETALLRQSLTASRDNPTNMAFENLALAMYPNHPYGNIGKRIEQHLNLIQRDTLVDYQKQWIRPENMVVSIVGDFDPDEVVPLLTSAFPKQSKTIVATAPSETANKPVESKLPELEPLKEGPMVTDLPASKVVTDGKQNQAATWIGQGWLAPGIQDADYVPLKVLNTFLGSGMSSRLFVNLREKQGLAYSVGSMYPSRYGKSQFVLYIGTDPKNQKQVLEGFNKEIERIKQEALTPEELQAAKDKLSGSFALEHETPEQQAFYLGFYETMGVGYGYDQNYPQQIQNVTIADIQRVANKYFSQPNILSIVSPQTAQTDTEAKTPEPAKAPAPTGKTSSKPSVPKKGNG